MSTDPSPIPGNTPGSPRSFTFHLSALLVTMTIVGALVAFGQSRHGEGQALAFIIAPPLSCIPFLLDRLLHHNERGLGFALVFRVWLIIAVGLYSIAALMLATVVFEPHWKGHKGHHPLFYIHDYPAGLTIWPIYMIGVASFVRSVSDPDYARRSLMNLVMIGTLVGISFWYAASCFFLSFTDVIIGVVPASVGICYAIYFALITRYSRFPKPSWTPFGWKGLLWISGLVTSIVAKYPIAWRFYDSLPDEPPESCFVVTAAANGSPRWVGSWCDGQTGRKVNRQLLVFWSVEDWLATHSPSAHRRLRQIYNRIGPWIAERIRRRWQANLTFTLLKPVEWLARGWLGLHKVSVNPSPRMSPRCP